MSKSAQSTTDTAKKGLRVDLAVAVALVLIFDLSDIFDSFFGGGFGSGSRQRKRRTEKYSADLEIPIKFRV